MLTLLELAELRADALTWLTDTCNIVRKVSTSDGSGGTTETWTTVGTAVPCMIYAPAANPNVEKADDRVDATTQWMLTLPAFTDVTLLDKIVYQGSATLPRTYEVANLNSPRTNEVVRRVVLNQIE